MIDFDNPINLFALGVGVILILLLAVGCWLLLPSVWYVLLRARGG